jgi:pilus assembly protein FimV
LKYRSGNAARVALSSVALAALVAATGNAWALGLGRLNVQSALGETLKAEIEISSLTPEEESSLKVRIASPEAYRTQGVDYNAVLSSTQVNVARRPDGRAYLRVSSDRAVQEPFVDVILELTWSSGRLVREFTLLLDPPQSRVAPPAQAAAPTAPQVSAAPSASPAPSTVTAAPTPPQAAAPATRPAQSSRGTTQASKAPAAALPSGADEYKVKEGDTLYRIAKQSQRSGVSLDQMLVALFRGNPNAFIGDNMNRLKAGAVLSVPSSDDANAVTTAEAREVIRVQSADFGAYRQRLAGNVPTTKAEDNTRQAKGKVTASVDDTKQAAAPAPDKLTLSQGAVKPGNEAKVSKEAEAKAAEARRVELAKNIEDLKKVQEGAAKTATAPAQPAPAAAPAAPATPPPAPPVEAKAPPPAPATPPPAPATTVAQAPAAEPPKAESPATPSVALPAPAASAPAEAPPVAAASAPAPRPAAPKPATPPVQAEEPGLLASLMDHPLAMPGAIGLVVLLIGLALYRLRGRFRKDNGETSFLESRLQPDSFFGASGGQRVDTRDATGQSSSMSYSLSQLDAIGDVDPVAEADVYLAYGRDLQAEEILKEAMRGNPDRLAIRTKLLEVYAKRRDTKGFEMLATQLYSLTKGEGDDWAKAQELGRQIDPENPLYKPGGAPVANVGDGGRVIEPLGASTMPQSIMPSTSGFPPSAVLDSMSPDSRGTIPPDLDLDLDLGTMPSRGGRTAAPAKPSVDLESISLDLNAPSAPAPLSSGSAGKPTLDFGDFTLPAQPSGHAPLDENDPLARKLELAEEFRQIGDMEGARDLLEEVVAKAGGALKTKAQSMLDSLA